MNPLRRSQETQQAQAPAAQPAAKQEGMGVVKTVAAVGLLAVAFGAAAYLRSTAEPDRVHDGLAGAKDTVRGAAAQVARGVGARNTAENIETERAKAVIKDVGYNVARGAGMIVNDVIDMTKET